ncbi:MAG: 50S ribosomal protein L18 [Nitrosomonadaceae bacterium]
MQKLIQSRLRRARQTRAKIAELKIVRLTVHRTNSHIYAQVIDNTNGKVLTSASTIEPEIRKELPRGSSVGAATAIGKRIAEKAKKIGISKVGFDRSGFKYHGRIRALADAAREHGLVF